MTTGAAELPDQNSPVPRTVIVVGAGLVAMASAWQLGLRGHHVQLLAPDLAHQPVPDGALLSGSRAALGILMGQVFHRSSGRAWRLRQRSLTLWQQWCDALAAQGPGIPRRQGLLLLAAEPEELERQRRLVNERRARGFPLELWERERLLALEPQLPGGALGALWSPQDGQLDAGVALEQLTAAAEQAGVELLAGSALTLERCGAGSWRLQRSPGDPLEAEVVVLANGLGATGLLASLDADLAEAWPLEPVLGQALELELADTMPDAPWRHWPGVVVWQGMNLVPRPDLPGGRRFWLGATVEPGRQGLPEALAHLRQLGGAAPAWLEGATVRRHWQGLRPRPAGRPAPLLEVLAPGLLLASGHHRNGVLLTPASAEWVVQQVEGATPGGHLSQR